MGYNPDTPSDWNLLSPTWWGGDLMTSAAGDTGSATDIAGSSSGAAGVSFTVTVAGSGLVFNNTITTGFSQAFENCIIAAEQTLAMNWTNSVTLNLQFQAVNEGNTGDVATNTWPSFVKVSYATLRAALVAHDQNSIYGQLAAASLPQTDPSNGKGFSLPEAYARMLGLSTSTPATDDTVTLNTFYNPTYGQDVINSMMHEISEGGMGRVGGLGDQNSVFSTMDLFRYTAAGQPDYTDGRDGLPTYFSYNGGQTLSSSVGLQFNNQFNSSGAHLNTGDTADFIERDIFGTGGSGETNTLSPTDIQVMDALGWTPYGTGTTPNGTTAEMVVQNSASGTLQLFDIGNNSLLTSFPIGQVGAELQFAGFGDFDGSSPGDMLLRDTNNGNFAVYDIANSQVTNAAVLGAVGLEWQVLGFGSFNSNANETDMLMRDSNNGAIEYYDIQQNQVVGAGSFGNIGTELQVLGFGDFTGNTNESDMLMRDINNGAIAYYDIQHNQVVAAGSFGAIGTEWQVLGFGDFSGNANETDMLMRDINNGAIEYYDIQHNQVVAAGSFGNIGTELQVAGFGNLTGNANETDMVMRNSTNGSLQYYDIQNNHVAATGSMGTVAVAFQIFGVAPVNLMTS